MVRERLLERLAASSHDGPSPSGSEDVPRSILESLRRILGSAQNDASTDPEYGLPDIQGIARNMPETTEGLREAILGAIQRYEPRLRNVRVLSRREVDQRVLGFDIIAEINDDGQGAGGAIKFATRLESAGRLTVGE